MKTTKKIFAAFLAVMMIALMIPFTASAAAPDGPYTATYVCAPNTSTEKDKVGDYDFSFFKIADLDKETGKYDVISTLSTNTTLVNAVNAADSSERSKNIISACDAIYSKTPEKFGDAKSTISFTSTETTKTASLADAGIYYIYCTKKPAKVKKVTNSLVALPYYSDNSWVTSRDESEVNLASKVSTNPVTVTKTADKTNVGDNDKTVKYTLTASTAGSLENKLTTYAITDTMDNALTLNESSVEVKLNTTTLTKGTDYTVVKNYPYQDENKADKTATFAIVFTSSMLNSADFYDSETADAAKTVTVTYTADLNANAASKFAQALPNTDGLYYGNNSGMNYEPGPTVNVYTYGVNVVKVDGNTNSPLSGAEFTVYTEDKETKELKELTVDGKKVIAKTGTDGKANFVLKDSTTAFCFDADLTYYVKETAAPTGYNINDTIFTVNIDTTKGVTQVNGAAIPNYKPVVPETGGMGTMMFTIGGAALIACAGVLFLIVRKKKSAK
ncbi:SpaH/EbpB family LPXTG-anchored major pilin [Ruminococcus sp.]|uniref:SpaH/EbpB family LPXTG-anchored major pilin n=1 Tax=Ruminococcus sp. TaxID=41978 RepID=UPI0025DEB36C|nr:SpaH/EbpB family LPXTG-anchored major pilin [Ruminococcus sp.]MCI6615719.1 SpaH/EbpB family LPXTG-anchored major pilin [Ruminococcus sp.]